MAAGNPTLFVPNEVSRIKWSTFATVAAYKIVKNNHEVLSMKKSSSHCISSNSNRTTITSALIPLKTLLPMAE